jgi:outer membrane protein TolC
MSPLRYLPLLLASAVAVSAHAEPMTYDQALSRARASAPNLEASGLRVEAARSYSRSAGALPDPRLTVGLDNAPISGPLAGRFGADEMTMARVGIEQDVPSGAKRRARLADASANIAAAEAQAVVEARDVRLATAMAWLDLDYAKRRLAALDALSETLAPILEAAPSGLISGDSRPGETVAPQQWRAMLADRRSELVALAARARAELVRWTGDPEADVEGDPPALSIDGAILRAGLDRHPVLLAYTAFGRQADSAVRMAQADKQPDWGWGLSYQHRDPMFGDMVSAEVTISLPLFSQTRQDPIIAARASDATRVRVEREVARRKLLAELEAGLADHTLRQDRRARARDVLVPLAQRRADFETASYGAGTAGLNAVLDAFTALVDAKLDALDREAEVARDAVRLNITYGSDDQ